MSADRARCVVFGCRRTMKRDADDHFGTASYICGQHWRMGDKRLRRLASKIRRQGKRYGWSPRMERVYGYIWNRIRRQSSNRMVGI